MRRGPMRVRTLKLGVPPWEHAQRRQGPDGNLIRVLSTVGHARVGDQVEVSVYAPLHLYMIITSLNVFSMFLSSEEWYLNIFVVPQRIRTPRPIYILINGRVARIETFYTFICFLLLTNDACFLVQLSYGFYNF